MDDPAKKIIAQIEAISLEIEKDCRTDGGIRTLEDRRHFTALHTNISSLIDRITPKNSLYNKNAQLYLNNIEKSIYQGHTCITDLGKLLGIIDSIKEAYSSGYFQTINEQINAEIFADFLDMAEFFLLKGEQWKNAAAFLIGGVLEEHLRKLSIKNSIPIVNEKEKFVHAEDLNVELRKKCVYNESERKQITALLGIRNDADHAHWDNYTKERVETMLLEVRRIINQYPA